MVKAIWIIVGVLMMAAGLGVGKVVANRPWIVVIPGFLVSGILILAGILTTFVGFAS